METEPTNAAESPYVIVEDADAVYQRVKAAGGEIVIDIQDTHYGSRDFSCRDLEVGSGTSAPTIPGRLTVKILVELAVGRSLVRQLGHCLRQAPLKIEPSVGIIRIESKAVIRCWVCGMNTLVAHATVLP